MTPVMTPRRGQRGKAGATATETPSRLRTTLYEAMAALQTVVGPDEDDLAVAVVAHWLRSGRITLVREGMLSASGMSRVERTGTAS